MPALVVALFAGTFPFALCAQTVNVHIDADGPGGKGFAVSRGLDCYVVTAAHVVPEPIPYKVVSAGRRSSPAQRIWRDTGPNMVDLAVLRVEQPHEVCGHDYYLKVTDVASLTRQHRAGVLRVRGEHGRDEEIPVGVGRSLGRRVNIYPQPGGAALGEGLSGGVLYIAGQPAGILTKVTTSGEPRGVVLGIDVISRKLAKFLPLVLDPEPTDQERADIARKTVNYMQGEAFCRNLWAAGKLLATRKITFEYTTRRQTSLGGKEYGLDSMLLPGVLSTLDISQDEKHLSLETILANVPKTMDISSLWRTAETAITNCMRSDVRKQVGRISLRDGLRRAKTAQRSMWVVERTRWGASVKSADIWLEFASSQLTLRVLAWY